MMETRDNEKIDLTLRSMRCFIADMCQQNNGGHPGGAMGMVAIGIALWKYTMKYSPQNPNYFNRDRFVLENGHTSPLLYVFLHLTGYKDMTYGELRKYNSTEVTLCNGHPEIQTDGVETSTGAIGEGSGNAIGLALASKNLGALYNREGFPVVDNMTWCTIGDAGLQEGVAQEAFQLAGHWGLNNLVVIYDNNAVTFDGPKSLACSEDVNARMRALGWNVLDVEDGSSDVAAIVEALETARRSKDKPTFINCRTVIGIGSQKAGKSSTHGAALGEDDCAHIKRTFGMDPEKHVFIPDEVYDFFKDMKHQGEQHEQRWNELVSRYAKAHPELHEEFMKRVKGEMTADWTKVIPKIEDLPIGPTPSRRMGGNICGTLAANLKNVVVGCGDVSRSTYVKWKDQVDFQRPGLASAAGVAGDYSGRYVNYGAREHAMAAAWNGLAAFNKGTFLPITSTIMMFYINAAPAIRSGATQNLQVIHVGTHDSIALGEDGPTHQPVGLPGLFRAMPNFLYVRPCDNEEVAGAFQAAIETTGNPSMITLSRHALDQYPGNSSREGVQKGAYVFVENDAAELTLIGSGSEMSFAVEAKQILENKYNIQARIVSFPSWQLFERQSPAYKRSILRYNLPRVVIEAYTPNGWERYATAGYSMHSFGQSLLKEAPYKHFGFDGESIAGKISDYVRTVKTEGYDILHEFQDLNKKR